MPAQHQKIKKTILILVQLILFFFPLCGVVQGKTLGDIRWQSIETKYTIIRYQSLADLEDFDDSIDYYPGEWGFKRLFSSKSSRMTVNLIKKVDALNLKVQQILDMRKRMKKVTINIYHNKNQLHTAYYKIYGNPCKVRAWYIYEYNTIYINIDDVNERLLAHEMAHYVIDNYLSVRPPRNAAEILASYADKHLYDEAKRY